MKSSVNTEYSALSIIPYKMSWQSPGRQNGRNWRTKNAFILQIKCKMFKYIQVPTDEHPLFYVLIYMVLLRTGYLQMYKETNTHAKDIREQMEEPKDYLHSYLTPTCHMLLDWMKYYRCNGNKKRS
jgi:hypothetical protein